MSPHCDRCAKRAKYESDGNLFCEGHAREYSITYGSELHEITHDWEGVNRPREPQPVPDLPGQGTLFDEADEADAELRASGLEYIGNYDEEG